MSSIVELSISPRVSLIGEAFSVRRALPFAKKRMIGPFVFLDHMGPVSLTGKERLSVLPHPHIGLSTLTYLFSGEILHRDNLGNEISIRPGEVNWMTAGRGVAHSERTLPKNNTGVLEGVQVWIALPKNEEDIIPSFNHFKVSDIPVVASGSSHYTLVAGSALGRQSKVPVYSPLFYIYAEAASGEDFFMKLDEKAEGGVYVARGSIKVEEQIYSEGQLICFKLGGRISFQTIENSRLIIIGGDVLPEKRYIDWNFVSSSQEKIERARSNWMEGKFPAVINEKEYLPYPNKEGPKAGPVNYP